MFITQSVAAQRIIDLYEARNYQALAERSEKSKNFSADDFYMVGYAFFQLGNDQKAIEMYDKAIKKGLDNAGIHFYKGLSLRYLEKYKEATIEVNKALEMEPANQEYMNEKGLILYYEGKLDEALEVFLVAKDLPETYPEPYYWIASIYHDQEKFDEALAAYYEALNHLSKENSLYLVALTNIGQLEFSSTKDYKKSIEIYQKAIEMSPKNFELYTKLIKSYNSNEEYDKADSVFAIEKEAFENGLLGAEAMKFKQIPVAEFGWNEKYIIIYRSFIEPKEVLDISYKIYLLNENGENIERRFMIEKTIQLTEDSPNNLLCEKNVTTGEHISYPVGWTENSIPIVSIKQAVIDVLIGETKPGASSIIEK